MERFTGHKEEWGTFIDVKRCDNIEAEVPDKTVLNMLMDKIYIYYDKSAKFELKIDISRLI